MGLNCSQVCYTDNNNTATCACFANYELQSDGKTCLGALIYCCFTRSLQIRKAAWKITPYLNQSPVIRRNSARHTRGSQLYFLGGYSGRKGNSPIAYQFAVYRLWEQIEIYTLGCTLSLTIGLKFWSQIFSKSQIKGNFACHLFARDVLHRKNQPLKLKIFFRWQLFQDVILCGMDKSCPAISGGLDKVLGLSSVRLCSLVSRYWRLH